MTKFRYAPGLPGYGTKGTDGAAGLQGIATYFSSFDGLIDVATLTNRILNNQNLFGSAVNIPGYPSRKYQTGDLFIDRNSKVFKIDFLESALFTFTGAELNTSGYFSINTVDDAGFSKLSNKYPTYSLDNVYSLAVGDYTSGIYQATNMYNIAPLNFATIHYSDINPLNISATASNYIPFMVFSSGPSLPGTADLDSFAIVKHKSQHLWRIGNFDGDPGTVRDVSLFLDFRQVRTTGELRTTGNFTADASVAISGNVNISGKSVLAGDTRFTRHIQVDGSTELRGALWLRQNDTLNEDIILDKTFGGAHIAFTVAGNSRLYVDTSTTFAKDVSVRSYLYANKFQVDSSLVTFRTLATRGTEESTVYISANGTLSRGTVQGSPSVEYFGMGVDGSLVSSSGTTTLLRDMYYNNVTLTGTGRINTNGFRLFISGTLNLANAPGAAIRRDGTGGGNGGSNSGATPGTAGTAGAALAGTGVSGASLAGGAGGAGSAPGAGAGGNGVDDTALIALSNGGAGGAGGHGGAGDAAGGTGGDGGTISYNRPYGRIEFILKDVSGGTLVRGGAGGGGGGGGGGIVGINTGGAGGGGGGAGGGVMLVAARNIVLSSSTPAGCITAAGGDGGNGGDGASSSAGGGGGAGGGGWIILIYETVTGSTANAFISAEGGSGGAAGSGGGGGLTAGSDGSPGDIHVFNIARSTGHFENTGSLTTLP